MTGGESLLSQIAQKINAYTVGNNQQVFYAGFIYNSFAAGDWILMNNKGGLVTRTATEYQLSLFRKDK